MIQDNLGIKPTGVTIFGRYGCYFLETAIKILNTLKVQNHKLDSSIIPLHETQFENYIKFLKSKLDDSKIMQHESYESPCIFLNGEYLGSLDDFTSYVISEFDIELHHSVNNSIPGAEKRKEVAFNTSENEFVKIGLTMSNDEWNSVHHLKVELFSKLLPKSCERFLELCKHKVDDEVKRGYINSVSTRVQKDTFIHLGHVPGAKLNYSYLEDEGYMIKHDSQGILGFIGGKTPHSNLADFYITLGKLEKFDKNYVAFGRVIEGMQVLKTVNHEQKFSSLKPNIQIKIVSCEVWEKKPTDEYLAKIAEKERIKEDCPKKLKFNGYEELRSYSRAFNIMKYNNGSEELELIDIKEGDDLNVMKGIRSFNTFNLKTLVFRNCHINHIQAVNLFQSGLFYNVVNWHFEDTNFDEKLLDIIFKNKYTKEPVTFKFRKEMNGNNLLKKIFENPKFKNLKTFAFNNTNLETETLEFLLNHPIAKNLQELDISHNFMIKEIVKDLLKNLDMKNLKTLKLDNCYLNPETILDISNNKSLAQLTTLDLSNNRGIDKGIFEVSKSIVLKNIEHLRLRNTDLTTETLFELTSSINFSNMKTLDISLNFGLKDDLAEILNDRPFARYLIGLNLEKCDITNETLKNLSVSPYLLNLKFLDISQNPKIDFYEIIEELEENKFLSNLKMFFAYGTGTSEANVKKVVEDYGVNVIHHPYKVEKIKDVDENLREEIEGKEPSVVEGEEENVE